MLFISLQKLFSFSWCLSFCLEFLVMQQNSLIKKIMLIRNFMTSQPGWQIIATHILSIISRNKGIQTMKFDQLVEYNMRNIFVETLYTKCSVEISPRPFSEKLRLSISLDQYFKVLYNLFLLYASWGLSKYFESKLQTTCFHLTKSFFFFF